MGQQRAPGATEMPDANWIMGLWQGNVDDGQKIIGQLVLC